MTAKKRTGIKRRTLLVRLELEPVNIAFDEADKLGGHLGRDAHSLCGR